MELFILQRYGYAKPEKECYKILLDKYSLSPSECLFIDDTLPNVEVARSLGINSIHFTNFESLKNDFSSFFTSL